MRLTPIAVVLTLVAGGFYGKLLHDRDLAKAREQALLEKPRLPDGAPPPPPPVQQPPPVEKPVPVTRNPGKTKPPKEVETLALLPTEERALEPARQLIAQGKFDAAGDAARAAGGPPASRGLKVASAQLADQALLLSVLTRSIQPHPFAGAPDLFEVTLASGVVHTARVLRENDQSVVLALADGRQLDVRPERIAKREAIAASAWSKKARGELEKRRAELGDAGALEIYHLACEAFEVGVPELGVPLLHQALADTGGGAVIDVYGSGDLEVLHRARERMRREAGNPGAVVVAEGRKPRVPREKPVAPTSAPPPPPPTPVDPTPGDAKPPETKPPETKPDPEPPPEPMAGDPNVSDFDKLDRDARWKGAQQAYKDGVAMYRDGFAGQSAAQKTNIREARTLLEKARGLLDELPQELGDAAQTWDQFSARVNALLRDVKKRQLATGS
jgi:hypothetical protein